MTTTVLVVDDQSMIRVGIRAVLQSQDDLTVVGEAADGRAAVQQAAALRPDLVLMDVRMPLVDGLEATRQLLAAPDEDAHRPRVLMLTTFDIDDYVYEALRVGASGFLLKDSDPDELLAAVRLVAAGEAVLAPGLTRRLIERYAQLAPPPASAASPGATRHEELLATLTDRELEVSRLLALGLSNTEISRQLFVVEQTIKTHVTRIFRKLELRDRVQGVVLAYETGLVKVGDRPPGS